MSARSFCRLLVRRLGSLAAPDLAAQDVFQHRHRQPVTEDLAHLGARGKLLVSGSTCSCILRSEAGADRFTECSKRSSRIGGPDILSRRSASPGVSARLRSRITTGSA
jgi:hypothetical protein